MTPDVLYKDFEAGFTKRKFSAGLLVAFIDFLSELGATGRKFETWMIFSPPMRVAKPRPQVTTQTL